MKLFLPKPPKADDDPAAFPPSAPAPAAPGLTRWNPLVADTFRRIVPLRAPGDGTRRCCCCFLGGDFRHR